MLVLHYVSIQDPTPLPYLQHSDAFNFDINLEVQLKGFCEWLLLFFFRSFSLWLLLFAILPVYVPISLLLFVSFVITVSTVIEQLNTDFCLVFMSVAKFLLQLFVSLIFIAVINDLLFTVFVFYWLRYWRNTFILTLFLHPANKMPANCLEVAFNPKPCI